MIMDQTLVFSEKQDISGGSLVASTNVHDTKAAADVGIGEEMYLVALAGADFAGGTNAQVMLQTSADNSTWKHAQAGPTKLTADLKKGAVLAIFRLPVGLERYLRTVTSLTGTFTGGSVTVFLVKDVDAQQYLKAV